MKNELFAGIVIALLVSSVFQVTLKITPAVFSSGGTPYKEVWKVVSVKNTHGSMNTSGNINITLNNRTGVHMAWSTNITEYFRNPSGYATYMEWLNGTSTLPYHWGDMDWYVTDGSLTSITWDEIKYWWDMYKDSGGGVSYSTFMGSTYMADFNFTDPTNNPDIIRYNRTRLTVPWIGNSVIIKDFVVPANTTIYLVLKIVITAPGAYTFSITSTNTLLQISPSYWRNGGVATIVVPGDYDTIGAAIAGASPGDTIFVSAGVYNEVITINKKLTIIGAGAATTTITGAPNPGPVVTIDATADVSFSGFTITGAAVSGGESFGMVAKQTTPTSGVTYTISDCRFVGTNNPAANGEFQFYASGGQEAIVFKRNVITQYSGNAIVSEVHVGPTEISYNTFDAPLCNVNPADVIFFMTYGGKDVTTLQKIAYNTFNMSTASLKSTAVTFSAPGPGGAQGNAKFTNVVITENTFNSLKNNGRAIGFWNGRVGYPAPPEGPQNNIISPTVTNNKIYGVPGSLNSYGIYFYDDYGNTTGATIRYNTITGMAVGIYLRAGDAPGTIIDCNNIYNNTIALDWQLGATAVDARKNFWGSEKGPTHSSNPGGDGDRINGNVEFKPWLVQTYPPAAPVSELYVHPSSVKCWTGMNNTFTVKVKLDNARLLYGFEFKLKWNSTLLNMTSASYTPLWTDTRLWKHEWNNSLGVYQLALSGKGSVPSFNGNTTLATVTFKITYQPMYPENATTNLALINTILSRTNITMAQPIPHVVRNGTYTCYCIKPRIQLAQTKYVVKQVPREFSVNITVAYVTKLEAFNFTFTYDPNILTLIRAQSNIVLKGAIWGMNTSTGGSILGYTIGITPAVNGSATLATIRFRALGTVWNTVNRSATCSLTLSCTKLTKTGGTPLDHIAINATYVYKPVPGDLDMDGTVTIIDLASVARVFGLKKGDTGWLDKADINCDNVINILDIVLIARNFGRTEPEP